MLFIFPNEDAIKMPTTVVYITNSNVLQEIQVDINFINFSQAVAANKKHTVKF